MRWDDARPSLPEKWFAWYPVRTLRYNSSGLNEWTWLEWVYQDWDCDSYGDFIAYEACWRRDEKKMWGKTPDYKMYKSPKEDFPHIPFRIEGRFGNGEMVMLTRKEWDERKNGKSLK